MNKLFKEAKQKLKPAIERSKFRVFVFGPGLTDGQKVDKPTVDADTHAGAEAHARYLRFATRQALEKLGFAVDYGESNDVLEFWQDTFLAVDPATVEISHAERLCGAIIVYPSSIGSICELGLFASRKWVCEKAVAIVHERYTNDKSFFRQGLLEFFDQEGGRHLFRNYTNHDDCITEAIKFVRKRYSSLLNAKVMHEQTGNRLKLMVDA